MNIDQFSSVAQQGLRLWAKEALADELAVDGTAAEHWAWIYFLLQVSEDRPEWFRKGKWATIQVLGGQLLKEAAAELVHP